MSQNGEQAGMYFFHGCNGKKRAGETETEGDGERERERARESTAPSSCRPANDFPLTTRQRFSKAMCAHELFTRGC